VSKNISLFGHVLALPPLPRRLRPAAMAPRLAPPGPTLNRPRTILGVGLWGLPSSDENDSSSHRRSSCGDIFAGWLGVTLSLNTDSPSFNPQKGDSNGTNRHFGSVNPFAFDTISALSFQSRTSQFLKLLIH
jgi:hypothetical protein